MNKEQFNLIKDYCYECRNNKNCRSWCPGAIKIFNKLGVI